ncbi:hypothetical protein HOY34_01410 [Xinfangfangia sp. D13-10-4-6]|uniref:hypothetical protein n=1 Tax=Pseudogemmobacter hezensis TaxID=2737662 RepID=UPI0015519A74|nr:hypothetical protein [Pseudogemmobacter hezensis]NPD13855.1 hypothetical protein [Pseudogemmobacter hezensis]
MTRLLSRAFSPGLFLVALGIVLIGLGAVLDHYDMTRAEWYAGEAGIVVFSLGSLLALAAVIAILLGGDLADEDENGRPQ